MTLYTEMEKLLFFIERDVTSIATKEESKSLTFYLKTLSGGIARLLSYLTK